jgi:hypothetical protein
MVVSVCVCVRPREYKSQVGGAQPAGLSAVTSNYTPRVNYAGVFASFLITARHRH